MKGLLDNIRSRTGSPPLSRGRRRTLSYNRQDEGMVRKGMSLILGAELLRRTITRSMIRRFMEMHVTFATRGTLSSKPSAKRTRWGVILLLLLMMHACIAEHTGQYSCQVNQTERLLQAADIVPSLVARCVQVKNWRLFFNLLLLL